MSSSLYCTAVVHWHFTGFGFTNSHFLKWSEISSERAFQFSWMNKYRHWTTILKSTMALDDSWSQIWSLTFASHSPDKVLQTSSWKTPSLCSHILYVIELNSGNQSKIQRRCCLFSECENVQEMPLFWNAYLYVSHNGSLAKRVYQWILGVFSGFILLPGTL